MSSHKNDLRFPIGRNRANLVLDENFIALRWLRLNQSLALFAGDLRLAGGLSLLPESTATYARLSPSQ